MAVRFNLFLVVILVTKHFHVCLTNSCLEFAKEGEVQYKSLTRTLTFSLENKCRKINENYRLALLNVAVTNSGTSRVLCNMVTKAGACVPSDACTCPDRTRFRVTWQVKDASVNEEWRLSAMLADGSTFLRTVQVQGSKEKKDGGNPTTDETEPKDGGVYPLVTSRLDFIMLGSIAGLLVLIVVVIVIVCKMKGQTPASAVRAIRRSMLYDEAYELRRPVVPVQSAYSQADLTSHCSNTREPRPLEAGCSLDGYTPMRMPITMGREVVVYRRDGRHDSYPDISAPPPRSGQSPVVEVPDDDADDDAAEEQSQYYSNMMY